MNPAEAAGAVIIDELLRAGVSDIVVAPGHRSAPLAVAAAAAAAAGDCTLHVRTDERVAGFLALGLARVSRLPVPVICTSGSAVANLLPAVTEADADGVPLVLVTADRPAELMSVGANQTIEQVGIFGSRVRSTTALEAPHWFDGAVRYWRSATSLAVNTATDVADPGPVHLNVALRAPLLGGDVEPDAAAAATLEGRPGGLPWTVDARMVSVASVSLDALMAHLGYEPDGVRGLVVVGHLAEGEPYCSEAIALAESLGWPLLSEPSGNAHDGGTTLAHGPLLAQSPRWREVMRPEVVVTVGRVGLHRGVNTLIADARVHIAVDTKPARTPTDPQRSADLMVAAVPASADSCRAPQDWLSTWLAADDAVAVQVAAAVDSAALSGPAATRLVWQSLPADALLLAAASWPVRFLDSYAPLREDPPWVIGNRGASGIDGLLATAWGAAVAHQRPAVDVLGAEVLAVDESGLAAAGAVEQPAGGPAVALVGDLAALYDFTGLLAPPDEPRPDLTVVVLDNDGGGIFSALEPAGPQYEEYFERVFGTAMGQDIAGLAAAAGVASAEVTTADQLADALTEAMSAGGVRVIRCLVGSRSEEAALVQRISQAAEQAVVEVLGG